MKILLAEDDRDMAMAVKALLTRANYAVDHVENGQDALDYLEDGDYDAAIMDIMMPVMDGIALALAVARDYPNLSILLMTGFADQRERAFGLDSLVSDVVSKPFTLAEIRTAVARALVGRSATEKIA